MAYATKGHEVKNLCLNRASMTARPADREEGTRREQAGLEPAASNDKLVARPTERAQAGSQFPPQQDVAHASHADRG